MTQERGYAKGRATRAELLDRAVEVFGEVGYRGASLREISARAGLSHPGLLHHFPTKEALLLAVLERRDQTVEEAVAASGATGAAELRGLVDQYAANAERPNLVELFAILSAEATAPSHPAHEYFAQRYARVVARLTDMYAQARAEGSLRPGIDPAAAARALVALMDGLQVQWLFDPESMDLGALVRAHVEEQLSAAS